MQKAFVFCFHRGCDTVCGLAARKQNTKASFVLGRTPSTKPLFHTFARNASHEAAGAATGYFTRQPAAADTNSILPALRMA